MSSFFLSRSHLLFLHRVVGVSMLYAPPPLPSHLCVAITRGSLKPPPQVDRSCSRNCGQLGHSTTGADCHEPRRDPSANISEQFCRRWFQAVYAISTDLSHDHILITEPNVFLTHSNFYQDATCTIMSAQHTSRLGFPALKSTLGGVNTYEKLPTSSG